MAAFLRKNFAEGSLASGINAIAASITVGTGHSLPTLAGQFRLTIWNSTLYLEPPLDPNAEIVTATYSTPNVYLITRAQESTTAYPHSAGDSVSMFYTAGVSDDDLSWLGNYQINETGILAGKFLKFDGSNVVYGSELDPVFGASPAAGIDAADISNWDAAHLASHVAITLATSADILLGLTGQQLSLDTQAATYVLAGPITGLAAAPTFRALAATDIPALSYEAPLTFSTGLNRNVNTITCTITQYTDTMARAAISETITGLDYDNSAGVFSLTSGYVIPTTNEESNWNSAYGWGGHAGLYTPLAHKTTEDVINGLVFVNGAGTYSAKAIGTDVQAYSALLAAIAGLAVTDSNIIVGDGATWVAESGATARTSLGLGTGDSPVFTGLTIDTDTLFVDSTNHRIGIGTTVPEYVLQIIENLAGSSAIQLQNINESGTTSHAFLSLHTRENGGNPQVGFGIDDSNGVSINHSFHVGIDNFDADKFKISRGGLSAGPTITITQVGLVGIGTTNPATTLDVNGAVTATGLAVDTNVLIVDATNNRVGINVTAPERELDITGTLGIQLTRASANTSAATLVLRKSRAGTDAVIDGDVLGSLDVRGWDGDSWVPSGRVDIVTDGTISDGVVPSSVRLLTGSITGTVREVARFTTNLRVGIRVTAPEATLHIDAAGTTGAIPVLLLDQGDVSEEFIRFIGTSANAVLTQSIVEAADVATATIKGYVKVYVQDDGNQLTDQAYFMPIYTLA